jgi:hypothetical protein
MYVFFGKDTLLLRSKEHMTLAQHVNNESN